MPYLPDLVPKESKVIPEYFNAPYNARSTAKTATNPISILMGLLFLAITIYFIRYVGFAALFGLLALSCTNGGKRWLEKVGRFSLSGVARTAIYGLVILVSIAVYLAYTQQDEVDAAARVAAQARAVQFTADSLRADSGRRKELFAVLNTADKAMPDHGLKLLLRADSLVKTEAEKDSLRTVNTHLQLQLVQQGLAHKDYRGSLATIQKLLANDRSKPELWFYRARCYIGLDSMQLAVNDLDSAKALNYKPASQLFEKVNPLKKHIVGYCTLCADGSTSSATGRGACSWHGGVAEWNHPIYETSRKYGDQ